MAYDRIDEALISMEGTVAEGQQLAADINVELNRQIEKLDSIHSKVKDTQSALNRAKSTISYFKKAAQCDRCLAALLMLNALALVTLIVLLIKK